MGSISQDQEPPGNPGRFTFGNTAAERIEIIPAVHPGKVTDYDFFGIADGSGVWMQTSPLAHNAFVDAQDVRLGQKVKPLIRLVEEWNFEKQGRMRSIYVEPRVAEFATGHKTLVLAKDVLAALKHLDGCQLAPMRETSPHTGGLAHWLTRKSIGLGQHVHVVDEMKPDEKTVT